MRDPRLVGRTVGPARERFQKAGQRGEGILCTLMAVTGIGFKGGHPPGSPALPCLHRQKFMPPADLIFACRDIREIPLEKVVAYARASSTGQSNTT